MSLNGKRDKFTVEDFEALAKTEGLKQGRAKTILGEVQAAAAKWHTFAEDANVTEKFRTRITEILRLKPPAN